MSEALPLKKEDSYKMFNDISRKYDLLNRVLSLGLDIGWRKKMAQMLPERENLKILDLATGTADVLLSMFEYRSNIESGLGMDMSAGMLDVGREKVEKQKLSDKIILKEADAHQLPLDDESFDAVTISFGIRNMTDFEKVLSEMSRVLKNQGKAMVLEFSLPKNGFIRFFHKQYLRFVVPVIGGLLTGNYKAYKYLHKTIEEFPYGNAFCGAMKRNGFSTVKEHKLLFGTATIYEAVK